MTRRKMIFVAIVCLLVSSTVINGAFSSRAATQQLNGPANVVIEELLLEKESILLDAQIGQITDFSFNKTASTDWRVACAGQKGVVYLDQKNEPASVIKFSQQARDVRFLNRPDSKNIWYLDRGGHGWGDSGLIDSQGQQLWSFGSKPADDAMGVDSMCAGTLDKSKQIRFVVGLNGSGGVRLLDENGHQIWRKPDVNVWQVELVDNPKTNQKEILHTNARGILKFRDAEGNELRNIERAEDLKYVSRFFLCPWPGKNDPMHILVVAGDKFVIMDLEGNRKKELAGPFIDRFAQLKAVSFKVRAGEPDYFAVIANYGNTQKAVFYVYDPQGRLVFQENIDNEATAIAAIPSAGKNIDELWISIDKGVWRYQASGK